ncbi:MAG TPA: hypothetical protein VF457_10660 [Burkholderiaceae bacterium]
MPRWSTNFAVKTSEKSIATLSGDRVATIVEFIDQAKKIDRATEKILGCGRVGRDFKIRVVDRSGHAAERGDGPFASVPSGRASRVIRPTGHPLHTS